MATIAKATVIADFDTRAHGAPDFDDLTIVYQHAGGMLFPDGTYMGIVGSAVSADARAAVCFRLEDIKTAGVQIKLYRNSQSGGTARQMDRLEALERRLAAVEQRHDIEAGLCASRDRDIADIRQTLHAQRDTIQAMEIAQSAHTEKLDRLAADMAAVRSSLDQIVGRLDQLIDRGDA